MSAPKLDTKATQPRKPYTFRLPIDVKEALAAEAAKYDSTEARVIVNLVRNHLIANATPKRKKVTR